MPTRRNTTHSPMKCQECRQTIEVGQRYVKARTGMERHEGCKKNQNE